MALRFPTNEEHSAEAVSTIEKALNVMHDNSIPFVLKDNDGNLEGPYGPLA